MSMQPVAPSTANVANYTAGSGAVPAMPRPAASAQPAELTPPVAFNTAEISAALDDVRNAIQPVASELSFSLDEDSGRMLLRIIDRETDEVIRQIPSEELVRIAKALDKFQGLFLDKEA